jgi:hypothetical protein
LNQGLNLPNLCSHDPTDRFSLARIVPVLEIAVAVALRTARAFNPTVHPAPSPISHSRLPAEVDRRGSLPHIGELWPYSLIVAPHPPDAWGRVSFLTIPLTLLLVDLSGWA